MNQLRIVSVCSCVGERGLGVNEGLRRAMNQAAGADVVSYPGSGEVIATPIDNPDAEARQVAAVSRWFRDKFDSGDLDNDKDIGIVYDATEFRFPAGRVNNGGILPRRQCAAWQKIEGPIWEGFYDFIWSLDNYSRSRVQIALPFPTKRSHIVQIRDLFDPEDVALRFEDLGSLAPQFMRRVKPLLDAGYRVGADTVPTDRVSEPGLATRFDQPRGYERVTWGVRARILKKWLDRFIDEQTVIAQKTSDTFLWNQVSPIIVQRATAGLHVMGGDGSRDVDARRWFELAVPGGMKLSLLLTGDPDDVMPVADLERVRPLLAEVRVQNVKDPAMREWIQQQRSQA